MTAQEAITKLTNIMHDDIYAWHPSILTAFGMAVDALRGADGDLISRKEAIDRIESHLRTGNELYPFTYTDKVVNHGIEIAASCVYNLPSAQPDDDGLKRCKFEYLNACKIVAHPTKDTSKSDIYDAHALIKALHPIFGDVEF